MLDYQKRRRRPAWLTFTLMGLPSRAWAAGFFWFSVAAAAASAVLGFFWPVAWAGLTFAFAAAFYGAALRWVDRNDQW